MKKLIKIPNVIKTFGNSMCPLLLDGDILYLKKIKFSKIKVNDIITVREKDHYFTHRVIYKTTRCVITKGDFNHNSDRKTYPKQIIGVVKKIKRNGEFINLEELYLFQDTIYFKEIVTLKRLFEKNKINFLILKGLPLHLYFEKGRPKRLYADCDLLVSKTDFPKAVKLLTKLNYKRAKGQEDIIISKDKKTLKNNIGEMMYLKMLNGFPVIFDIHVEPVFITIRVGNRDRLYPTRLLEELNEKFLKEKITIITQNETFPTLSFDNLFIYLILHIFHHNFKGSYRYGLISRIIKSKKLNYEEISKTVNYFKIKNFVYPILLILNKYFNSGIPTFFLNSIKPGKITNYFIKDYVLKINIFDDASVEGSGERFKNIFFSSPVLLPIRAFVFANISVIYTIMLIFIKKCKLYLSEYF